MTLLIFVVVVFVVLTVDLSLCAENEKPKLKRLLHPISRQATKQQQSSTKIDFVAAGTRVKLAVAQVRECGTVWANACLSEACTLNLLYEMAMKTTKGGAKLNAAGGGVMGVSMAQFDAAQSSAARGIGHIIYHIEKCLGVTWSDVKYADLQTDDTLSVFAARILVALLPPVPCEESTLLADQATYYNKHLSLERDSCVSAETSANAPLPANPFKCTVSTQACTARHKVPPPCELVVPVCSHIEAAGDDSLLVNKDFMTQMSGFNACAKTHGTRIVVTSSYRDWDSQLELIKKGKSAALTSNHLLGHAIDFNLKDAKGRDCDLKCLSDEATRKLRPGVDESLECFQTYAKWGGLKKNAITVDGQLDYVHLDDRYNTRFADSTCLVMEISKLCAASVKKGGIPLEPCK
jgi:hypothetical protein